MPLILRPPRNTICTACYEGARNIIAIINKLEGKEETHKGAETAKPTNFVILLPPPNSCDKPLAIASKWMNNMKEIEDQLNKKIGFLSGLLEAFREQIHTDIQLKPGSNNGHCIPAHRALLAARSEIFKNMLDSDSCKAAAGDTITLPEMNSEELNSLLEFLYGGTLSNQKMEKHVYSLFLAADKYEIPYLEEFCQRYMLESLNSSNVLDVLEIADVCSNKTLKETALRFVVRNMEDVAFSAKYEAFAPKNPHLCVEITRAFFINAKNE